MHRQLTPEVFAKCYDDAMKAFEELEPESLFEIHIHYQMWGSTTCGFPGIGGCAMTNAPTIVIQCNKIARIYHNGRFAYEMDITTPEYKKYLEERRFPGVSGMPKK